jgi:hypothetical protein
MMPGLPVRLQRLRCATIRRTDESCCHRLRDTRLDRSETGMHIVTKWDLQSRACLPALLQPGILIASFVTSAPTPTSFTADRALSGVTAAARSGRDGA